MKAKKVVKYLCVACSTIDEPVYTKGRKHKDGTITCGKCGSSEIVKNVKNLAEAISKEE